MEKYQETFEKVQALIKKKKSLQEVSEILNLKDYEIIGLVKLMREQGYLVDYVDGDLIKLQKPTNKEDIYEIPNDMSTIPLLIISDTHLTNKAARLDILKYLYEEAEKKGVKQVLHVGDLTDGIYTNRPQQINELICHGYDEHLDYVVEKYPRFDGKIYFVGGNHMQTYFRNGGSDLGRAISKEREDMVYLNPDTADLKIGKLNIRMHHGSGGKAYSVSYKLQKYAETINPKDNIHMVLQGHFHNAFYMYYQNMHCFQVGALIDETPFSRSLGLKNEKSCYWVNVQTDSKGNPIVVEPKLETFEHSKKLSKKR